MRYISLRVTRLANARLRRRIFAALTLFVLSSVFGPELIAQPRQQEEFVPIDQLRPGDQLPAGRLLVAAYSVIVVGLFVYVMSVARRLQIVQRELTRLEADLKRNGRV